jgi:hypothetical protein
MICTSALAEIAPFMTGQAVRIEQRLSPTSTQTIEGLFLGIGAAPVDDSLSIVLRNSWHSRRHVRLDRPMTIERIELPRWARQIPAEDWV